MSMEGWLIQLGTIGLLVSVPPLMIRIMRWQLIRKLNALKAERIRANFKYLVDPQPKEQPMAINTRDLARIVTIKEGKKKSLSIAQVLEVLKILRAELREYPESAVTAWVKRP